MQDTSAKQQTKQKYKPNHQHIGLQPHLILPIRGKTNKQQQQKKKKKQHKYHLIGSSDNPLDQP